VVKCHGSCVNIWVSSKAGAAAFGNWPQPLLLTAYCELAKGWLGVCKGADRLRETRVAPEVRTGVQEAMPQVLWGVACLSLPEPSTVGDVVREFREALTPLCRLDTITNGVSNEKGASLPRVDLYRLVPIGDNSNCRLAGEEHVLAHLPDCSYGCAEIEDVYRQRNDAELRYGRARDSLISLMEELEPAEAATSKRSLQIQLLRQENRSLRYKLDHSERIRQELQETASMLQNEFCTLVHEVLPCAQQPSVEVGDATWSGSGPCRSTINGAKAPGLPLDYARQMSACEGPSSAGAPTASLQSGPPAVVPALGLSYTSGAQQELAPWPPRSDEVRWSPPPRARNNPDA